METKILLLLVVAFIHMLVAIAVLHGGLEPRWIILYFILAAFYGALYFRQRLWHRHGHGRLYRGLGYTAVMLGASVPALFFNGVDLGVPLHLAIAIRLVAALISAYCLFRIIVLHLGDPTVCVCVPPPV